LVLDVALLNMMLPIFKQVLVALRGLPPQADHASPEVVVFWTF
jgi:hypothetical protein